MWWPKRLRSDKNVAKKYFNSGCEVGDALSYSYMGEPIGFDRMLRRWEKWEEEHSRRGYNTISLDAFIQVGGYGNHETLAILYVKEKRLEGKTPILHAKRYKEKYPKGIEPSIDMKQVLEGKVQTGDYELPSTVRVGDYNLPSTEEN